MKHAHTKQTTLRSGELARVAGVSTDTLRHYERKGLLAPARAANGYREHPQAALDRVLLIRRALAVGFGLDDLARILQTRDQGGMPCREVRTLAVTKLDAVEAQIIELIRLRDDLREMVHDWDVKLAETPVGERARLLETLVSQNWTT